MKASPPLFSLRGPCYEGGGHLPLWTTLSYSDMHLVFASATLAV